MTALLQGSLQLYPKAQEKTGEGAAGGPDGPGWARAPGIPAASAGSRMGRKPAPASSPRILWAAQPGRTEAVFVPAPSRHPRLARGFEFPGGGEGVRGPVTANPPAPPLKGGHSGPQLAAEGGGWPGLPQRLWGAQSLPTSHTPHTYTP